VLAGRVTVVAIFTHVASVADVSLFAVDTSDVSTEQFNTWAVVRAGAWFAVVWCASQCVSVVSLRATLAVVSYSVVLADTTSVLNIAHIRMTIAVAWYATSEGVLSCRVAVVPWGTGLTELTYISLWAGTLLNMADLIVSTTWAGRLQLNVIQEADSSRCVGASNLDGCDVGEKFLVVHGGQYGHPLVVGVLMQTEFVILGHCAWYWVGLGKNWGGDSHSVSFNDDVEN